jgi:hypothetical protein
MSLISIILLNALFALLLTGLIMAVIDLKRSASKALDKRKALRACKRGWDWPAFEQEVGRYLRSHRGHRPAAPPPR